MQHFLHITYRIYMCVRSYSRNMGQRTLIIIVFILWDMLHMKSQCIKRRRMHGQGPLPSANAKVFVKGHLKTVTIYLNQHTRAVSS